MLFFLLIGITENHLLPPMHLSSPIILGAQEELCEGVSGRSERPMLRGHLNSAEHIPFDLAVLCHVSKNGVLWFLGLNPFLQANQTNSFWHSCGY